MHERRLRSPRLSRRASLALLAGALLPWPTAVLADPDATCHRPHPSGSGYVQQAGGTAIDVDLEFHLAADGSAQVHGTIQLPDTDPPGVLVAVPRSATATCADLDNDGVAGLTTLTAQFWQPSGDKDNRYDFVLGTGEGEITAGGIYPVALRIGERTLTTDVEVRFAPDRTRG